MDAFESLIAMLLKRHGYWTSTSVKVDLTLSDKRRIGRHSSPRWEIDVVAYKASTNELLAIECKSFLDSTGVMFRNGKFEPEKRYKLFVEPPLRAVVLKRLAAQLVKSGACASEPRVQLCLAVGKFASRTDRPAFEAHFKKTHWRLFDPAWVLEELRTSASCGYENDLAYVVSKILIRGASSGIKV